MDFEIEPENQEVMRRALAVIDDHINRLERMRNDINDIFFRRNSLTHANSTPVEAERSEVMAETPGAYGSDPKPAKKLKRKEQIFLFLQQHGPMLRREIIEQTGIPKYTVNSCLNDKTLFRRDNRWQWYAKDQT